MSLPVYDADNDPLTIVIVDQPAYGTATADNTAGTIVYTPDPAMPWGISITFSYKVTDPYGGESSVETVTIGTPPNTPPTVTDIVVTLPPAPDGIGGVSGSAPGSSGTLEDSLASALTDSDVVFVVDHTTYAQVGTYNDGGWPVNEQIAPLLTDLGNSIDFSRTKVAFIKQGHTVDLMHPLSHIKADYDGAVASLTASMPAGLASLAQCLQLADSEVSGPNHRAGANRVIVLVTAGAIDFHDSDPNRNAFKVADTIHGKGIKLYVASCGDVLVADAPEIQSFLSLTNVIPENMDWDGGRHGCKFLIRENAANNWTSHAAARHIMPANTPGRVGGQITYLMATLGTPQEYAKAAQLAGAHGLTYRIGYNCVLTGAARCNDFAKWEWMHPEQSTLTTISPLEQCWGGRTDPSGVEYWERTCVVHSNGELTDVNQHDPYPGLFQVYVPWLPSLHRLSNGEDIFVDTSRIYGSNAGTKSMEAFKNMFKNMCGTYSIDIPLQPISDPDGDPLSVTLSSPSFGSATLDTVAHDAAGTLVFTGHTAVYEPGPTYTTEDSFTYTADDGKGGTATGTVTIVSATPATPTATDIAATVNGVNGKAAGVCTYAFISLFLDVSMYLDNDEYNAIFDSAESFVTEFDYDSSVLLLGVYWAGEMHTMVTDSASGLAWLSNRRSEGRKTGAELAYALNAAADDFSTYMGATGVPALVPASLYTLLLTGGKDDNIADANTAVNRVISEDDGENHALVINPDASANIASLSWDGHETITTLGAIAKTLELMYKLNVRDIEIPITLATGEFLDSVSAPSYGTAEALTGGKVRYTAHHSFFGTNSDTFTYIITNGSNTATANIDVTCTPPGPPNMTVNNPTTELSVRNVKSKHPVGNMIVLFEFSDRFKYFNDWKTRIKTFFDAWGPTGIITNNTNPSLPNWIVGHFGTVGPFVYADGGYNDFMNFIDGTAVGKGDPTPSSTINPVAAINGAVSLLGNPAFEGHTRTVNHLFIFASDDVSESDSAIETALDSLAPNLDSAFILSTGTVSMNISDPGTFYTHYYQNLNIPDADKIYSRFDMSRVGTSLDVNPIVTKDYAPPTPLVINIINDYVVSDLPATISSVTTPSKGTVEISTDQKSVTYYPGNMTRTDNLDSFDYTVTDGVNTETHTLNLKGVPY